MYTLAVEIHGLRQLERLQPELTADIRRRVIAVIEVQGGTFAEQQGGLWIFRFERAQADDRQGVLDAFFQTISLLRARESELAGWSAVLDYVAGSAAEASQRIREQLLPVYEDNAAWLGDAAHSLLAHHLELDEERRGPITLHRVIGPKRAIPDEVGTAAEFARSESGVEAVLEKLVQDELVGGMLVIVSDDPLALRANTRAALEQLVGSSASVHWLESEADDSYLYGPLVSAFSPLDVHETSFWLRDAERGAWEERLSLVEALTTGKRSSVLPDALDTDLLIALEWFLVAYVRRAAAALVPPVLLCHNLHEWPAAAVEALVRIVDRLPVPEHEPALTIVATSTKAVPPTAAARLVRETVRLPHLTAAEIRTLSAAEANWERLIRLTSGRAPATAHYLANARHWDSLTDRELEGVTDADLAWRVVRSEDSEIQELLLAAHYAWRFTTREQYTEIAVRLGSDRVRVPTALSRLRALGLIDDRERVVPLFPEHRSRLETTLGRASRTVYEKVGGVLLDLVDSEAIVATEPLVRFLESYHDGEHLPRLYHQLLARTMCERRLADAHRLLYDTVPPQAYHPTSRACMQAVISADRLRLALLEGNAQVAERTRRASERAVDAELCDVAAGDLAVEKARFSFQQGPSQEAIAMLKRAILVYQELDDQAGLARANLDFGLILLAQEDLLGAREYFLLASRSAGNSPDVFEQMRARVLMLVCDFVYGNLSRSLAQADELDERAAATAMREIQLFAELARGRIAFELGRYAEASDVFSRGRSRARLYAMHEPGSVMERWLARSLIYDGRVKRGVEILRDRHRGAESCFFLAEGLLRAGEHGEAIAMLEEGLEAGESDPDPLEGVSWSTGFAPFEDRAIGVVTGSKVLKHQMMALRGYLFAESGRPADGVQEMHRLTRELRISEIDPYNRIYFYLYSLILPESGELNVEDRSTVLGKAVRFIQQRTSRMDEYTHKTDYLRLNYWNSKLMSHAQTHNLV